MYVHTSASVYYIGVALIPLGAVAVVPSAVCRIEAMAGRAPARVVSCVEPGGAAVAGVPDRPVEDDGHGEVVGPVEVLVDIVVSVT
jgi:hypothetical protein